MKYLEVLTEALRDKFDNETRTGVHVSDLTLCPRKAVFRKLSPTPCTMRDLNFFTSGRAIHDSIQQLANYASEKMNESIQKMKFGEHNVISNRFDIEQAVEWEGIVGHIDLLDTTNNIPIECKSARMKEMDVPKAHYVSQLKAYMAILGSKTGTILVQLLLHFDDKPFREFEITMTEEEINTEKQKLILDKEFYLEALEKKDPMIARGVVDNKEMDWLCKSCPHLEKCCKNQMEEKKSV